MSLIHPERPVVAARANWSRWIVDCLLCRSALQMRPGSAVFRCWECGLEAAVVWPDVEMQRGVERLLSMRPDPATRNWWPGETLVDLMVENAEHGIFAPFTDRAEIVPGESLFQCDEQRVVVDRLPARRRLAA